MTSSPKWGGASRKHFRACQSPKKTQWGKNKKKNDLTAPECSSSSIGYSNACTNTPFSTDPHMRAKEALNAAELRWSPKCACLAGFGRESLICIYTEHFGNRVRGPTWSRRRGRWVCYPIVWRCATSTSSWKRWYDRMIVRFQFCKVYVLSILLVEYAVWSQVWNFEFEGGRSQIDEWEVLTFCRGRSSAAQPKTWGSKISL